MTSQRLRVPWTRGGLPEYDKTLLEFGCQAFEKWEEREVILSNSSKVAFSFVVDLAGPLALPLCVSWEDMVGLFEHHPHPSQSYFHHCRPRQRPGGGPGGCDPIGRLEVHPSEGTVKGNDKVRLGVRFCPRVPDRVEETFFVRVAHFEPQAVKVTGIGQYTQLLLSLPRSGRDRAAFWPPSL